MSGLPVYGQPPCLMIIFSSSLANKLNQPTNFSVTSFSMVQQSSVLPQDVGQCSRWGRRCYAGFSLSPPQQSHRSHPEFEVRAISKTQFSQISQIISSSIRFSKVLYEEEHAVLEPIVWLCFSSIFISKFHFHNHCHQFHHHVIFWYNSQIHAFMNVFSKTRQCPKKSKDLPAISFRAAAVNTGKLSEYWDTAMNTF